jgi:hypothetical protein
MERHLFIVARDQADLHEYLAREFASEGNVEVILDRRTGVQRRAGHDRRRTLCAETPDADRRRAQRRLTTERRLRQFVDSQLRSLGYAMLRVG